MSDIKVSPIKFDGTINLPFLFTVGAAITAGIVWSGTVTGRLDRLEERTAGIPAMESSITRIDERSAAMRESLARIERQQEGER